MVRSHQRIRLLGAAVLSMGLFFVIVGTSFAQPHHAKVISSDPAINSVIKQAPTKITVTTAENMKPGATNSNLEVYGPDDALISQGNATVSLNDPTKMSINIKGEKDGIYIVRWYTVSSDDGDAAHGAFAFTVGSAAASTTSNVQPTAAAQTTSNTNTSSATSGTPIWVLIVSALVALIVGLGIGLGIGRTRKSVAAPASEAIETPATK